MRRNRRLLQPSVRSRSREPGRTTLESLPPLRPLTTARDYRGSNQTGALMTGGHVCANSGLSPSVLARSWDLSVGREPSAPAVSDRSADLTFDQSFRRKPL